MFSVAQWQRALCSPSSENNRLSDTAGAAAPPEGGAVLGTADGRFPSAELSEPQHGVQWRRNFKFYLR